MPTLAWLLAAAASAACFYLGTRHQKLRPSWYARARVLRAAGLSAGALSLAIAVVRMGPWAGSFAALTAFMLVAVMLPYVDAWRTLKRAPAKAPAHVG